MAALSSTPASRLSQPMRAALNLLVVACLAFAAYVARPSPMPAQAQSATSWYRGFSNGTFAAIAAVSDGLIVAGSDTFYLSRRATLQKFSPNGHRLWQYSYDLGGGLSQSPARRIDSGLAAVIVAPDGDLIAAGGAGADLVLLRTDPAGAVRWIKRMQPVNTLIGPIRLIESSDGHLVVTGSRSRTFQSSDGATVDTGSASAFAIKATRDGAIVWSRAFGPSPALSIAGAAPTDDGGVLLAGSAQLTANGRIVAWLTRLDAAGDAQWTRAGSNAVDSNVSALARSGDGFIIAGTNALRARLMRLNASGDVQWRRELSVPEAYLTSLYGLHTLPGASGDVLAFGVSQWTSAIAGPFAYHTVVMRVSGANGSVAWHRDLRQEGFAGYFGSLMPNDVTDLGNGFVLAGYRPNGDIGFHPWLLRLDATGDFANSCGMKSGAALNATSAADPVLASASVTNVVTPLVTAGSAALTPPYSGASAPPSEFTARCESSSSANAPPTGNAGDDQLVGPSALVTLGARALSDPDGDPVNVQWRQVDGITVDLVDIFAPTTTFRSPAAFSRLVFKVRIVDNHNNAIEDEVVVVIGDAPATPTPTVAVTASTTPAIVPTATREPLAPTPSPTVTAAPTRRPEATIPMATILPPAAATSAAFGTRVAQGDDGPPIVNRMYLPVMAR